MWERLVEVRWKRGGRWRRGGKEIEGWGVLFFVGVEFRCLYGRFWVIVIGSLEGSRDRWYEC